MAFGFVRRLDKSAMIEVAPWMLGLGGSVVGQSGVPTTRISLTVQARASVVDASKVI